VAAGPVARAIVGWREWVALPDLGIARIEAKLDTGAKTSAIHAYEIEPFERRGRDYVRFRIHPKRGNAHLSVPAEARLVGRRRVKASSGHASERPVIRTVVVVDGRRFPIEITLADRDQMGYRMLLGRQALGGRFLVDPGRSHAAGRYRSVRLARETP